MRHRHLDAVDAALAAQPRGRRVPGDEVVDLRLRQRARLGAEARRRDRRRRDRRRQRRRGDLLAPAVEELHEQPRAVPADGGAEALVGARDRGQIATDRVRGEESGLVHRRGLEKDRAGAAARTCLVIGDEVAGRQVVVDEAGLVRGGHDAVAQDRRPEPGLGEQGFVRHPSNPPMVAAADERRVAPRARRSATLRGHVPSPPGAARRAARDPARPHRSGHGTGPAHQARHQRRRCRPVRPHRRPRPPRGSISSSPRACRRRWCSAPPAARGR